MTWDDHTNRIPTKCETCKLLSYELTSALNILDSGEELHHKLKIEDVEDKTKKHSKKYKDSELRLIEAITAACRTLLDYEVHPKRPGSRRYSKDPNPAIKVLKDIKKNEADVDIGIHHEIWDTPSIEIMRLKRSCDTMVELYEEDIEDWFFYHRKKISLQKYLCEGIVLKNENKRCLYENKMVYKKDEL